MRPADMRTDLAAGTATVSRCPVAHDAPALESVPATGGCPVMHGVAVQRSLPDTFMRRLLRIPDDPGKIRERDVQRLFSTSIVISAVRCLLSYIVFPILAPTIGAITKTGAFIGIPVGIVALIFDVLAVRRFWLANHRYRWPFTIIYAIVMVMVSVLFVRDIGNLV